MDLSAHALRIGLVMVLTASVAVLTVARVTASHEAPAPPPPQATQYVDTSAGSAAHARNAYRLELASQER